MCCATYNLKTPQKSNVGKKIGLHYWLHFSTVYPPVMSYGPRMVPYGSFFSHYGLDHWDGLGISTSNNFYKQKIIYSILTQFNLIGQDSTKFYNQSLFSVSGKFHFQQQSENVGFLSHPIFLHPSIYPSLELPPLVHPSILPLELLPLDPPKLTPWPLKPYIQSPGTGD